MLAIKDSLQPVGRMYSTFPAYFELSHLLGWVIDDAVVSESFLLL